MQNVLITKVINKKEAIGIKISMMGQIIDNQSFLISLVKIPKNIYHSKFRYKWQTIIGEDTYNIIEGVSTDIGFKIKSEDDPALKWIVDYKLDESKDPILVPNLIVSLGTMNDVDPFVVESTKGRVATLKPLFSGQKLQLTYTNGNPYIYNMDNTINTDYREIKLGKYLRIYDRIR
jgi:hypothetical protein